MVNDINTLVLSRSPKDLFPPLPENHKTELANYLDEFGTFMKAIIKETESDKARKALEKSFVFKPSKQYPKEAEDMLLPILMAIYRVISYPDIFYDMTLTHIVTITEAFLGEFLVHVLTFNPNILKSENTITYKEVLSFLSIQKLIGQLSTETVGKIIDGNIDQIAKGINQKFSVDFCSFKDFDYIRESFYRRNIIVHNNARTDKKYCSKVPNSHIGKKIKTDSKYVNQLFDAVGAFIDYTDEKFSKKFKYERVPNNNALIYFKGKSN
jgi:hypothetical protein